MKLKNEVINNKLIGDFIHTINHPKLSSQEVILLLSLVGSHSPAGVPFVPLNQDNSATLEFHHRLLKRHERLFIRKLQDAAVTHPVVQNH